VSTILAFSFLASSSPRGKKLKFKIRNCPVLRRDLGTVRCKSTNSELLWLSSSELRLALVSICEIDVTSFSEDGRGVNFQYTFYHGGLWLKSISDFSILFSHGGLWLKVYQISLYFLATAVYGLNVYQISLFF
jgi:hypothetical protein